MNNQNELIKRIDEAIANMAINSGLLRDCRAEIERLKAETDHLTLALEATVLVRNNQSRQIDELKNEIERFAYRIAELEKPYVPMTRDELNIIIAKWQEDENWEHSKQRLSEAVQDAVIKRYNEQRSVK